MRNKTKQFFNFIKQHKFWSTIGGLIIIGFIFYFLFGGKSSILPSFVAVQRGMIREEVSVTGNVKPLSDVNLAFERGGRVASINVRVGDRVYSGQVLASVANADLVANLDRAKADLKIAELQLGSVTNNTIQNSQLDKATLDLSQTKGLLMNSIKDSYTKADDAVRNKIYSLFTDATKYNSGLSFPTDTFLLDDIKNGRNTVSDSLDVLYQSLFKLDNKADLSAYYFDTKNNLIVIKSLLDKCAEAVSGLETRESGISQTQIDTWKANISNARANIDSAISTLVGVNDQYQTAILALKTAQNNFSIQGVTVEQARAGVASAEAELAKSVIKSPIDGVVTNIDPKLGEIVSANMNILSVISYGDYEVEAFIPEADIAKVEIGDLASTTLDAYGSGVNFDTKVIKIDPASTVIEGVPTYKVTLKFINQDERIKSGMTANLDVLTAQKDDVLIIPARAIYSKNGDRYVKVLGEKNLTYEVKVTIGLRGSIGDVEITSGLQMGDKVVTSL